MALRILIGYARPGQRGRAEAVCVAETSAEIDAARVADTTHASFGIINSPLMIRKNNPNFNPKAKAEAEAKAKAEAEAKAKAEAEAKAKAEAEAEAAEAAKAKGKGGK